MPGSRPMYCTYEAAGHHSTNHETTFRDYFILPSVINSLLPAMPSAPAVEIIQKLGSSGVDCGEFSTIVI